MMAPMRVIDVRGILKFYYISHITLSLYDIMVFFVCCLPTILSYGHIYTFSVVLLFMLMMLADGVAAPVHIIIIIIITE